MNGLVGFFDILGYQSFLINNSATESALKVLEIINDVPKQAKDITAAGLKKPVHQEIAKDFSHLVFSDTIVFTIAYPENADSDRVKAARRFMQISSMLLTAQMFKNGLPIRGVMHEGDFITQGTCLAGKAIVEAYQLCETLDYSGLVCTPHLGELIIKTQIKGTVDNDSDPLFNYLAPMKGGSEVKLLHANWMHFLMSELHEFEKNAENFVLQSFWAHQKDCSKAVDSKVHNTTRVMRKMLQNIRLVESKEAAAKASEQSK